MENIVITAYGPFSQNFSDTEDDYAYKEEPYTVIYKDKEKIEKILESFVSREGNWKNGMCLLDEQYEIELTINNQKLHGKRKNGFFQQEKIPDFVIQDFLAEEKKR